MHAQIYHACLNVLNRCLKHTLHKHHKYKLKCITLNFSIYLHNHHFGKRCMHSWPYKTGDIQTHNHLKFFKHTNKI